MKDEFLGRDWADHHAMFSTSVSDTLSALFAAAKLGFERLNAYQFDAPWKQDPFADQR